MPDEDYQDPCNYQTEEETTLLAALDKYHLDFRFREAVKSYILKTVRKERAAYVHQQGYFTAEATRLARSVATYRCQIKSSDK